jgi:putative heme-binding domain-containing protein
MLLSVKAVSGPFREIDIKSGIAHQDPLIRDLYERYVPEEKRIKRLGSVVKAADLLKLPGDLERGRRLFAETANISCRNCHRIGDVGKQFGPDLATIGKKLDKPKLLESILEPSKTIDPQFAAQLVETSDGQVLSGLLVRRDEKEVVLRHVDGKESTVAVGDIELIAPQQKSLMPELLLQDLTAQQVADLLEYLSTLK